MKLSKQEELIMAYAYTKRTLEQLQERVNNSKAFKDDDYEKIKCDFEYYERAVLYERSLKGK